MKKRFLQYSLFTRWSIAVLSTTLLIVLLLSWIDLVQQQWIAVGLIFVVVPLIQFLTTPLFSLLNVFVYYSPMVVAMGESRKFIDLHNGTSFDYLMDMRGIKFGAPWKRQMLIHYLSALKRIITFIEEGELPKDVVVRGSTYFLSERMAKRFGFKVLPTTTLEKTNLVLNYLDLVWMYSASSAKFQLPNLKQTLTLITTGEEITVKKKAIQDLLDRLG